MKKKGSFLGGLLVFILVIIILGGVGYLGFNIINNSNGMAEMNMASSSSTETKSTDTTSTKQSADTTDKTKTTGTNDTSQTTNVGSKTTSNAENAYKVSQINQLMINKEALDKAYDTIDSALDKMTLDPYASDSDTNSSMSDQMANGSMSMGSSQSSTKNNTTSDSKSDTTVNVYNGAVSDQSTQSQNSMSMSMGTTYDADKMQKLHSGLYKVSVGMQLLKQLQDDVTKQIEEASVDTSNETEYYMNQYYKTIALKNKLINAFTYIDEAVDLININPYVDANGLVYDQERMTSLHDSIYTIAQGVVDLNELNDNLLSQSVNLGSLVQNAYNQSLQNQNSNSMSNMNMSTSSFNINNIVTIVLVIFVAIFIIGFIGAILNLFKSGNKNNA